MDPGHRTHAPFCAVRHSTATSLQGAYPGAALPIREAVTSAPSPGTSSSPASTFRSLSPALSTSTASTTPPGTPEPLDITAYNVGFDKVKKTGVIEDAHLPAFPASHPRQSVVVQLQGPLLGDMQIEVKRNSNRAQMIEKIIRHLDEVYRENRPLTGAVLQYGSGPQTTVMPATAYILVSVRGNGTRFIATLDCA